MSLELQMVWQQQLAEARSTVELLAKDITALQRRGDAWATAALKSDLEPDVQRARSSATPVEF